MDGQGVGPAMVRDGETLLRTDPPGVRLKQPDAAGNACGQGGRRGGFGK